MEDTTRLLLEGAKGLKSLAEALERVAGQVSKQDIASPASQEDIQPDLFDQQPDITAAPKKEEIPLSLTDVRKILAEKSREGYTEQVRMLLGKYGAEKLSAIEAANYKDLADEAKCLGATLEDLQAAVEEKTSKGFGELLPALFEHHYATSLEDLKPSNYPGFLRDIRRMTDE